MLKSLQLENFRAFKRADIALTNLNIFVGPNNSGKSSIISALSLIAQNVSPNARSSLALNGAHTQLGTFYDVVHGHSARSAISIGFEIEQFKYAYTFRYRPQRREIELVKATISDGTSDLLYEAGSNSNTRIVTPTGTLKIPGRRARFFGLNVLYPFMFASSDTDMGTAYESARRLVSRSMTRLNDLFRWFDSVGAFRVAPERTYYFSGEAHVGVGVNGQNSAQILASSSSRQRTNILGPVVQSIRDSKGGSRQASD